MRRISLVIAGLAIMPLAGCPRHATHTARAVQPGAMTAAAAATAGFAIAPAADAEPPDYAGDKGPAQVFEITRPDGGPLVLGRLWLDCTCVQASSEKTVFGDGERALVTVRQVQDAPKGGATYNLHVQIKSPAAAILTHPVRVE